MALAIKWNRRAQQSFHKIVDYLESEFGTQTAKVFVQKNFSIVDSISEFPELGTVEHQEKNIRGFVITKHNTLFYRHTNKELILLHFFDTRQNPKKRK